MALPGSLPLALSQIKTEFGGASTLGNYHRGQLYVPNHSANASISTSGTVTISSFLGAEKNFTCSMSSASAIPAGFVGYSAAGGVGSVSRSGIGTAGNSLTQVSFDGLYDFYTDFGFGPVYVSTFFLVGGSVGGFWTTISFGALSLSRASSNAPGGTATGGGGTYWDWGGGPYLSAGTATFTCTL